MNKKTYTAPAVIVTAMVMQSDLLTLSSITATTQQGTYTGDGSEDIMGGGDPTTSTEHELDAKDYHYSAWETWDE